MGDMPPVVTKAAYGRHRQITRQSVDKAIGAGRIGPAAITEDGRIIVAVADEMLGPIAAEQEEAAADSNSPALAVSKARKAHADAQKAEIELAELQGRLIDRDVAFRQVQSWAAADRDAILAWPARAAPIIAAEFEIDQSALHTALDESLRAHLTERAELLMGR
jgi:hypothetical protein